VIGGIEAVIPSNASHDRPCPLDRTTCRRRNAIERMFGRLETRRRIATPYDRLASNLMGRPRARRRRRRTDPNEFST